MTLWDPMIHMSLLDEVDDDWIRALAHLIYKLEGSKGHHFNHLSRILVHGNLLVYGWESMTIGLGYLG